MNIQRNQQQQKHYIMKNECLDFRLRNFFRPVKNQFVILLLNFHPIYVMRKPKSEKFEEIQINLIWEKQIH
jgi:hypothetical protein